MIHLQTEGIIPRHEGHWDLHDSGRYDPPLRERQRGGKEQQPGRRQQARKGRHEGLTSLSEDRKDPQHRKDPHHRKDPQHRKDPHHHNIGRIIAENHIIRKICIIRRICIILSFLVHTHTLAPTCHLNSLRYTHKPTLLWHPILITQ